MQTKSELACRFSAEKVKPTEKDPGGQAMKRVRAVSLQNAPTGHAKHDVCPMEDSRRQMPVVDGGRKVLQKAGQKCVFAYIVDAQMMLD
eukprot:scaffold88263_cov39-Prasinocladus_malaysianus.AAC.2